jgi:hypothetical protein
MLYRFVSTHAWNMGINYRGVEAWSSAVATQLAQLREQMRPGSRIVWFVLHTLHPSRCANKVIAIMHCHVISCTVW